MRVFLKFPAMLEEQSQPNQDATTRTFLLWTIALDSVLRPLVERFTRLGLKQAPILNGLQIQHGIVIMLYR